MDSALCNNIFALPPWIIVLVVFLIIVWMLYGKYRKFKDEMENYHKRKNKRKDVEEEIEEVDLPDYNRFIAIEILLAVLAFGTALFGLLASNNITYSFAVNQACIVSSAQ